LDVARTQFRSLDVLRGAPLRFLNLGSTSVADIGLLSQFKTLERLTLRGTSVRDFSVLRSLNLKELYLEDTGFSDIRLIEHMTLQRLGLSGSKVTSLNGLNVTKLGVLYMANTRITDIQPLRGAPLTTFHCHRSSISDYSPLRGAPIRDLRMDSPDGHLGFLDSLKELRRLNGTDIRLLR